MSEPAENKRVVDDKKNTDPQEEEETVVST